MKSSILIGVINGMNTPLKDGDENENVKLLWDMNRETWHCTEEKEKRCSVIDIGAPADVRW